MSADGDKPLAHALGAGRVRRAGSRLAIAVATWCILFMAPLATRAYATAVLTTTTPAPGGTATAFPIGISATFDDTSTVLGTSVLSVDGVAVPAAFSYPVGYWFNDGCDITWVVTDDTVGRLDYSSTTITDGVHSAAVTVYDSAAETVTLGWSFQVSVPPQIGTVSPADGGYAFTATPTISAQVLDNDSVFTATMTVDSTVVATTYDAGTKTFSHVPTTPLVQGLHSASITVADALGRTATRSWSFSVSLTAIADFSLFQPSADSTVTTVALGVSVRAHDLFFDVSGGTLLIDGVPVGTTLSYPIGYWYNDGCSVYWVPSDCSVADLSYYGLAPPDGPHTATARITNSSGLATETSWPFYVSAPPAIGTLAPADGAVVFGATPTISATIVDNDSAFTATMTVDGSRVVPSYDAAARRYSYVPSPELGEGTHTIGIEVADALGRTASRTWTFQSYLSAIVDFSNRVPSADSTVTTVNYTLGVRADDSHFPFGGGALSVDGTVVSTSVSFPIGYWTGYYDGFGVWVDEWVVTDSTVIDLSHSGPAPQDGPHVAKAHVTNASGLSTETTWPFYVSVAPTVTSVFPLDGGIAHTMTPTIAAVITDNDTTFAATMTVDGSRVTPAYNAGAKRYSYVPSPAMGEGTHTVQITVSDAAGATASRTWSFRVTAAAVAEFSMHQPAPNTTASVWNPPISIRADDAEYPFPAASWCGTLSVDGTTLTTGFAFPIGYWYNDGCDIYWVISDATVIDLWADPGTLTDGPHTAKARVINAAGLTTETAWPFNVAAGPHIGLLTPVPNSTAAGLRPVISFEATDNSPGTLSAQLQIDGVQSRSSTFTQGPWAWTPTSDLLDDTTHTCTLTVWDAAGNPTTVVWSFKTQQFAAMPNPDGCAACHTGYPVPSHPTGNCVACHGSNCAQCHGWHGPELLVPRNCDCHGGASHHGDMDGLHTAPMADSCRACHTSVLTREHARWPGGASFYGCATCHASTVHEVTSAIAAKDTRCAACHGTAADHLSLHGSNLTRPACATCHSANLEQEHVRKRRIGCKVCHGKSAPPLPKAGDPSLAPFLGQLAFTSPATGKVSLARVSGAGSFSSPLGGTQALGSAQPLGNVQPLGDVQPLAASSYSCGSCHDPAPHGTVDVCGPCHGQHNLTTDGSEPTTALGAYTLWTSTGPNAAVPTPHKDYQLATRKCSVCHAVHKAPTSGEVLLRGTIEGACEYCHVATNIGAVVVYAGSLDAYWEYSGPYAHNRTSESSCRACHSVHGANTLAGASTEKILWDWSKAPAGRSYSPNVLARWPNPATVTSHDGQITAWCTGCHKYYVESHNGTVTPLEFDHHATYSFVPTVSVQTHVMTSAASAYNNPSSLVTAQVAFAGSGTCRSCHDAGDTDHGPGIAESSFPHYTRDYYRFMTIGSSLESSGASNAIGPIDGMCLKCHASSAGGVGVTY